MQIVLTMYHNVSGDVTNVLCDTVRRAFVVRDEMNRRNPGKMQFQICIRYGHYISGFGRRGIYIERVSKDEYYNNVIITPHKEYRVYWVKDSECTGYKYFDDFMSAFYFADWCYCGGDSALIERYDYKTRSYMAPYIQESPDYIIVGEKICKKEINPNRVDI